MCSGRPTCGRDPTLGPATIRPPLLSILGVPALLLLVMTGDVRAQEPNALASPPLRIAVLDITGKAEELMVGYTPTSTSRVVELPPPDGFARGLTQMLTTSLVATDRFVVLERLELDEVLEEQEFGASGRVNPETAAGIGGAIGAQVLVTGDITEFHYERSSAGGSVSVLGGLDMEVERFNAMVALDLRLIDAVTGEVLSAVREEGTASATGADLDVDVAGQSFGTAGSLSTPLGQASREAIEKIVTQLAHGLANHPWEGRIVDVRDGVIYVNAGYGDGIRTGMTFDVYREEEPLIDPATGRVLGAPEERLGSIRITTTEEAFATAEPIEGGDFARDDLLRYRAPASESRTADDRVPITDHRSAGPAANVRSISADASVPPRGSSRCPAVPARISPLR